jgi:ubiquinone/menaquinone biosynthesis C-methylase UbiE
MNNQHAFLLEGLFSGTINLEENLITFSNQNQVKENNQKQTKDIFSDKWVEADEYKNIDKMYQFQCEWFLKLYGFETEEKLAEFLMDKKVILDSGCGLGYKASWFAKLAPNSIVIGIDISDALDIAANRFKNQQNLFFLKGDIAQTGLNKNVVDFTVCDQVIMHTEDPQKTFDHLADITSQNGEFACYVYSKKALPRELVDDYFREATHNISKEEMWKFSEQLTVLGKTLSELNINFECPDIPLLGIKGGTYDIQRFIYWNFLKCFWKEDWGFDLSKCTNFDWYAPSNARRFSQEEFLHMATRNNLKTEFLHQEEACYSGRFKKQ